MFSRNLTLQKSFTSCW